MSDQQHIPIKKEPSPTPPATTIGGVQRVSFVPRIPPRRKAGTAAAGNDGSSAAAATSRGSGALDLIKVKSERPRPGPRLSSARQPGTTAPARVAFQPSQPGDVGGRSAAASASSGVSGEESRENVTMIELNQPMGRGGVKKSEEGSAAGGKAKTKSGAAAGGEATAMDTSGSPSPTPESESAVSSQLSDEEEEEAELMGGPHSSYDSFLDNGDLVQYRPILLPFPRRVAGGLAPSTATSRAASRATNASPASGVFSAPGVGSAMVSPPPPGSGPVASMFEIEDENEQKVGMGSYAAHPAAAAAVPSSRSASPSTIPSYKAFRRDTPARLLSQIDYEEKLSGEPSNHLLFFQFPSHLPFKQAPTWQPPANPLLTLNGMRHQSNTGAGPSAMSGGASTDDRLPAASPTGTGHIGAYGSSLGVAGAATSAAAASARAGTAASSASASASPSAPSPSLQALQALSSPMLPPLAGFSGGGGMPSFSLGRSATPPAGTTASSSAAATGAGAGAASNPPLRRGAGHGNPSSIPSSNLMDEVGTASALAAEEEQDLGEVDRSGAGATIGGIGGGPGLRISESERLAREHKARQQRKLLLFSSNFEHALRHLPPGQLGKLVIYKSGKIKMKIGDIVLDVNEGVQCLFHQELMSIHAATGEASRLGPIHHRLVCTTDVEDLVRKAREQDTQTTTS